MIGSMTAGLRLNSLFPTPVQETVRSEDVVLPCENGIDTTEVIDQNIPGSLFDHETDEHNVNAFQYSTFLEAQC